MMYRFKEKILIGLDVTWVNNQEYETHVIKYEFEEPVPDWVVEILSMQDPPDPDFDDIFIPRIGVEYILNKHFVLRSGYIYQPTSVPDQKGMSNYLDSNKHVISFGGGVTFHDPWDFIETPINIDLVFQAQLFEKRSVIKDDPEDPVGNYTIDGEIFLGGIYFRQEF